MAMDIATAYDDIIRIAAQYFVTSDGTDSSSSPFSDAFRSQLVESLAAFWNTYAAFAAVGVSLTVLVVRRGRRCRIICTAGGAARRVQLEFFVHFSTKERHRAIRTFIVYTLPEGEQTRIFRARRDTKGRWFFLHQGVSSEHVLGILFPETHPDSGGVAFEEVYKFILAISVQLLRQ